MSSDEIPTDTKLPTPNAPHPDAPAERDRLGRRPLARRIARTIHSYDSEHSITLGILGPWGSGKTTLLNMIREEFDELCVPRPRRTLRDNGSVLLDWTSRILWPWSVKHETDYEAWTVFEFNPWLASNVEDLVSRFLKGLAEHIDASIGGTKTQKLADALRVFGKALAVADTVPSAGTVGFLKHGVRSTARSLTKYSDKEISDFARLKSLVDDAVANSDYKILVVIDDIDRLSDEQIAQVFQLIRAVADFPNTVFVIACDEEVVSDALDNVQQDRGRQFLGKVIQMPFHLPDIPVWQMREIVRERVVPVKITDREGVKLPPHRLLNSYHIFWDGGLSECYSTLRDVKRMQNKIRFRFGLISEEVNPVDFTVLESLREFVPEAYKFIRRNSELTSESGHQESPGRSMEHTDERLTAMAREKLSEASIEPPGPELIKLLFAYAFDSDARISEGRDKSIEHQDFFPRYFSFESPPHVVSETRYETLIDKLQSRRNGDSKPVFEWWYENRRSQKDLFEKLRNRTTIGSGRPGGSLHSDIRAIALEGTQNMPKSALVALCQVWLITAAKRERADGSFEECWDSLLEEPTLTALRFATMCLDAIPSLHPTGYLPRDVFNQMLNEERVDEYEEKVLAAVKDYLKAHDSPNRLVFVFAKIWAYMANYFGGQRLSEHLVEAPENETRNLALLSVFQYLRQYEGDGSKRTSALRPQAALNEFDDDAREAIEAAAEKTDRDLDDDLYPPEVSIYSLLTAEVD